MRIKKIERLIVKYHEQIVGTLSLTPDNKQCAFEYDKTWLSNGFSISPLELPLKPGLFIAKPSPFYGNFGVFEDSLPDGYGRHALCLHALFHQPIAYGTAENDVILYNQYALHLYSP